MRRHEQRVRAAAGLDEVQRVPGVPARQQHRGGARQQGRKVPEDEAADEAELTDDQMPVFRRELPAADDLFGRVAEGIGRMHDALGQRCRARRMEQHREVVRVHTGPLPRARRAGPGAAGAGDIAGAQGQHHRHLVFQLPAFGMLGLGAERDDGLGVRLAGQCRQLLCPEHRRQRRRDRTAVQAGEQRHRRLNAVTAEEEDDVSGADGMRSEPPGEGDRRALQPGVADVPVTGDERVLGRSQAGAGGELGPEITRPPVALGVVALGVRLESQDRHRPRYPNEPHYLSLPVTFSQAWPTGRRRPRRVRSPW